MTSLLISQKGDIVDAETVLGASSCSCHDLLFELECVVLCRHDWHTLSCVYVMWLRSELEAAILRAPSE